MFCPIHGKELSYVRSEPAGGGHTLAYYDCPEGHSLEHKVHPDGSWTLTDCVEEGGDDE